MTHTKIQLSDYENLMYEVRDSFGSGSTWPSAIERAYGRLGVTSSIRRFLSGERDYSNLGPENRLNLALHVEIIKRLAEFRGQRVSYLGNDQDSHEGVPGIVVVEDTAYLHFFAFEEGIGRDGTFMVPSFAFEEEEGDEPQDSAQSTDLVVTQLTDWASGYVMVSPSPALMEGLPEGLRRLATRAFPAGGSRRSATIYLDNEGNIRVKTSSAGSYDVTPEQLIRDARTAYREMIRARMGAAYKVDTSEFERKREAHREKTRANFEAFVRNRKKDEDQHILKLPFVPHGLASSRRWGIEVESGGARGVETPKGWDAKGDGSLRSAYEGYVEVQDFEPFDEEVTERVIWQDCPNSELHNPYEEIYDSEREEYMLVPIENYIDPRECESCGDVTRIVHREPQTIHHTARGGDCREFVSPILTSMHSKGLEALTTALSKNPQNDSAGVHVHVEASDLTKEQVATMVYGYDILEPILEASYRRNRRDFCERRDAKEVLEAARAARSGGVTGNEGGRYRTLNTHSLSNHGTLEFRAMGPVYEYEYLIRWAMLCRELVNAVANGAKTKDFAKIKSWDDLTTFLAMFGKEYIRAAVYEMTGEVGEAAKLEKAGEPVTTEALDTDLRNLIDGAFEIGDQFRALARQVTAMRPSVRELAVAVAGTPEV